MATLSNEEFAAKKKELFMNAFDEQKNHLSKTYGLVTKNTTAESSVNLSSIASILINTAGRWCEYYSSDVLISWDSVKRAIEEQLENQNNDPKPKIIVFGFRKSGVDHDSYVFSNITQNQHLNIDDYYAKIYAVGVSITAESGEYDYKRLIVELKDISQQVSMAAYDLRRKLNGGII